MIYNSHISFNVFLFFITYFFILKFNYFPIISLSLVILLSLLPDIDHSDSKIAKKTFSFNNFLIHRKITHSILFILSFLFLFFWILFLFFTKFWLIINYEIFKKILLHEFIFSFIFIFWHLLWDILTNNWLKYMFFPLKLKIKVPLFNTWSFWENLFIFIINLFNFASFWFLLTKQDYIFNSLSFISKWIDISKLLFFIFLFQLISISIIYISFKNYLKFLKKMFSTLFFIFSFVFIYWLFLVFYYKTIINFLTNYFNNLFISELITLLIPIIYILLVFYIKFKNYSFQYFNFLLLLTFIFAFFFFIDITYISFLLKMWS